jgi:hypothetical protein
MHTGHIELANGAVVSREYGSSVPQGVEHGEAESLVERGVDRESRGSIKPAERGVGEDSEEPDATSLE